MKLITKTIAAALTAAYAHSAVTGESGIAVVAKFFTPWANATWFISEGMPVNDAGEELAPEAVKLIDPDSVDWHLFGFCDLGDSMNAELGYVMLSDLKSLVGFAGLKVERDLHYSGTMADVLMKYQQARAA